MEHTVTTKKWYVVTGTAGATVTSPDGKKTYCTVPEGGQGVFYATAPKVVTSDDSVEVVETTFNSAPVKMRLLGLLGGGVSTGLPVGYLAAAFLESTGTQYIVLNAPFNNSVGLKATQTQLEPEKDAAVVSARSENRVTGERIYTPYVYKSNWYIGWNEWLNIGTEVSEISGKKRVVTLNYLNDRKATVSGEQQQLEYGLINDITADLIREFLLFSYDGYTRNIKARLFNVSITQGRRREYDLIAAVDAQGVPCMFDKVTKQPFYKSGTGQFIVGMTLSQARKLGELPNTGGELTVSLPSNYADDEGVVNALATAQENGWVITIQTYEAEAGTASTFALRRIWVRKRADEQGSYVDTDGFRWQVEWCVDIVGSSPEAEGYEPFRSVDVAVNYWNLQPWVDPEHEEILTNTNEQ